MNKVTITAVCLPNAGLNLDMWCPNMVQIPLKRIVHLDIKTELFDSVI